jgi:hypothetical protein
MTNNINIAISKGNPVSRAEVFKIIRAAVQVGEIRFAKEIAEYWLSIFKGDLGIDLLYAQSLLLLGDQVSASSILKRICNIDPEFLAAQKLLAQASNATQYSTSQDAEACILALENKDTAEPDLPAWGLLLSYARTAIKKGEPEQAETYIQHALNANPPTPLAAVSHLLLAKQHYEWLAFHHLVRHYQERWPDCLVCNLFLADTLMQSGKEEQAVAIIHQSATNDIMGQVPNRVWGEDHPYKNLWPQNPQASVSLPIPALVSGALGWNQLPVGNGDSAKKKNTQFQNASRMSAGPAETPIDIKEELEQAQKETYRLRPGMDARFPVYVVLSSRHGLINKYGQENFDEIDKLLNKLVAHTKEWRRWNSILLYTDQPQNIGKHTLSSAAPSDPWSIKNLISDLDEKLRIQGEMIGAILIVGGPDVVPFHKLPNPVEDIDVEVPSDNPYATPDENYFVPIWPVGRLPGGAGSDPNLLIKAITGILDRRKQKVEELPWYKKIIDKFRQLLRGRKKHPSFGYTAEIWRRASHSVYRPIGEPRSLAISPPSQADQLIRKGFAAVHLGYFNLHGLEDAPEWYGQRDPLESPKGPDYPIALRPQDVVNSGRAPQIVFSEACYGAHIIDKNRNTSLALKFLSSGSQAVIGSTCTSYGSITMPLIAADLLGQAFWKLLLSGHPAGEALQRAKIHLAREMHKRQGYLDGEDQKTLISFVLYGDPLARPNLEKFGPKSIFRENSTHLFLTSSPIKEDENKTPSTPVPDEVLTHVKKVVKTYLPGMNGARVSLSRERLNYPPGSKSVSDKRKYRASRKIITLSKQITQEQRKHKQFARITLDDDNKVIKLAVSR